MPGPVPKKASQRRRRNTPASQGDASDVAVEGVAEQPELGFDCHQLVADMWQALEQSVEGKFFSHADWQRARFELFFVNNLLTSGTISAVAWQAVQSGLSALLISPADKRRVGIELKKRTEDPDEEAAVIQMAAYQDAVGQSG